jgi:hypothetical protein
MMTQRSPYHPSGTLIANRYELVQGPLEKRSLEGGMGVVYPYDDDGHKPRRKELARL